VKIKIFYLECSICNHEFAKETSQFAPISIFNCPECNKQMEVKEISKMEDSN